MPERTLLSRLAAAIGRAASALRPGSSGRATHSAYRARQLAAPVREFLRTEAGGGVVLLVAAVVAIAWANSPWDDQYFELLHQRIAIDTPWFDIDEDLHHWINDGLMAIFFFVVGLEIKREVVRGELASPSRAALPALAALGGLAVPALIFAAFTAGGRGSEGWGIPMATDIAFAVGVLALLGNRIPFGLKVFLLALAIVDDLGAIAVIAMFYTDDMAAGWLFGALGCIAVILLAQRAGIRNVNVYVLIGIALWIAVLQSGVHATLAGVALGLLTPARSFYSPDRYLATLADLGQRYQQALEEGRHDLASSILLQVEAVSRDTESPLDRLEHAIHPWSSYVVIPVFALANAGLVVTSESIRDAVESSVTYGIIAGLLVGKFVGVLLATWLTVRLGIAVLPAGVTWAQVAGVALIAGIGFTVSLFVTDLAYADPALIDEARAGVFVASIVAGVAGFLFLRFVSAPARTAVDDVA
jgi:NhaA family Na+:H+ antiporter